MLRQIAALLPAGKARAHLTTLSGLTALLGGRKLVAAALIGRGLYQTELAWRTRNPEFTGEVRERIGLALDAWEATHTHPVHRALHAVDMPLIAGGTIGLFIFRPLRPLWMISAAAFTTGWAIDIVSHAVLERSKPAYLDDPLTLFALPLSELPNLREHLYGTPDNDSTPQGVTLH